ncbi:MAG: hypothetical protein DWQ01_06830 [Planctomycetota bacterium]|nr:MAG: hypothetical protein DWQ01_06830 [Planctomycetota bacterium]
MAGFAGLAFSGASWSPFNLDASADQGSRGSTGPDVYLFDLYEIQRWGRVGDITSFSFGTESCNQGDTPVKWIENTPEHPVISQELYRLHDGRFEQIGLSWVKHGFASLNEDQCGNCTHNNSSELGPGCSDPYSAGLNGFQLSLGPRSEINAFTGDFPYPPGGGIAFGTLPRRLQVHTNDLDPAQYPGARYFAQGYYINADDVAAGNALNNASHREVTVSGTYPDLFLNLSSTTQHFFPAIYAWRDIDPSVTIQPVKMPNEGYLILGYKVTDNMNGTWTYEYALHNHNSDLGARAFAVPIPQGVTVTDLGFHDVDHHSGEPYSGADWTTLTMQGHQVWATAAFSSNPNANALRWGTLYNFRFTADSPPAPANAVVGVFKPSNPDRVFVPAVAPQ